MQRVFCGTQSSMFCVCDIIMEDFDSTFCATRDLDLVLIVEALTPEFGQEFWRFIQDGKYRNKSMSRHRWI